MTNFKILNRREVGEIVNNFKNITFSELFADFLEKSYGFKTVFLKVSFGENYFIIPVSYKDGRAYSVFKNYSEPYFSRNSEWFSENWHKIAKKAVAQLGYDFLELRFSFLNSSEETIKSGLKSSGLSNYVLNIDGLNLEDYYKKIKPEVKRAINKSKSFGFEIKICGKEILDELYLLYLENMDRHRTPPKKIDYFSNLFNYFGSNYGIVAAFFDNKLVGANVFIFANSNLLMLNNLSKTQFWNGRVNNLLYYKMIEFAILNKLTYVDFGPNSDKDTELSRFKLGFGAERKNIWGLKMGKARFLLVDWFKMRMYNLKIRIKKLWKI